MKDLIGKKNQQIINLYQQFEEEKKTQKNIKIKERLEKWFNLGSKTTNLS